MGPAVIEFVFFKIRPEIKPEAPKTNDESEALLNLLRDTRLQHGYQGGAWGRTVEDENFIVWVIGTRSHLCHAPTHSQLTKPPPPKPDWADARGASRAKLLTPFLQPQSEVLTMYITLTPAMGIGELCANPITQLCPFTFPTSLSPDEHNRLNQLLINLRVDGMENTAVEVRPRNWWMGHVDRPGTRAHPTSPSGEAFVVLMVVGWESVEAHLRVRDTEPHRRSMRPIKEWLLPTGSALLPGEGLGLTHVKFVEI